MGRLGEGARRDINGKGPGGKGVKNLDSGQIVKGEERKGVLHLVNQCGSKSDNI